MHILHKPSFFLTNTIGDLHGFVLGLMNPLSSSSCTFFLISAFSKEDNLLYLWLWLLFHHLSLTPSLSEQQQQSSSCYHRTSWVLALDAKTNSFHYRVHPSCSECMKFWSFVQHLSSSLSIYAFSILCSCLQWVLMIPQLLGSHSFL